MRGFPLENNAGDAPAWMTLPRLGSSAAPEQLTITREHLRRAEFGRNGARRKFPKALVRVVGDLDVWSSRTDAQLAILKDVVHNRTPYPKLSRLLDATGARTSLREAIARLTGAHKSAGPVVACLVWVHWQDEAALSSSLKILNDNAENLMSLHCRLDEPQASLAVLKCIQLLEDGADTSVLDLIVDRRCWEIPLGHDGFPGRMTHALKAFRSGDRVAGKPHASGFGRAEHRLGRDLVGFICGLNDRNRKIQHRKLRLLRLLVSPGHLERWQAWWDKAGAIESQVRSILGGGKHSRGDKVRCRALEKLIHSELKAPRPIRWRDLDEFAHAFCTNATPKAFDTLSDCLEILNRSHDSQDHAHRFLEHWFWEFHAPRKGWKIVIALLSEQSKLLEALSGLEPERSAWACGPLTDDLMETWIGEAKPQRLIKPTFKALRLLVLNAGDWCEYVGPFADYTNWDALVAAVGLGARPEMAARIVSSVPTSAGELEGDMWTSLLRLSDLCPKTFQAVAGGWHSGTWSDELTKEFSRLVQAPERAELIKAGLIDRQGKRLNRVIARSSLIRSMGHPFEMPPSGPPPSPIDLSPYPEELHGLLDDLARWDPNAAGAADRILSKDYPRRENLQAELATLRDMEGTAPPTAAGSLRARIGGIERRLTERPAVSEKRLGNYVKKLERRIRHCRLQQWERDLEGQLLNCLRDVIGPSQSVRLLEDEDTVMLLSSFASLEPKFRDLAFRLVRARCGPRPWDLRNTGPNQAFLEGLKRQGVLVDPWLDGIGPRPVHAGPQHLTLDLEADPMEVLRMGEPFDTCLAPGSFNFFSAVANAADINKRVLYARDDNGTVRGRCLLALTDEGHILVFNVYAHTHQDIVADAVTAYVHDLAVAMGTSVTPRGHVRNLIAGDWYDDGPLDLTGQLRFLEPDSAFGTALPSMSPSEVVPQLEKALAGDAITPPIVRALVQSPVFQSRPDLITPLLPYIGREATLDPSSCLQIAALVRMAGDVDSAERILNRGVRAVCSRQHEYSWLQLRIAEELIELGLSHRALRLIRQTRPRDVRTWEDEWDERVMVAAKAYEGLYRSGKALELYRVARKMGHGYASACIKRLEQSLAVP